MSQSYYASKALKDTDQPLRVLLLNPDVTLYVQTTGGVLEPQDEWTDAAIGHIRTHLKEIFAGRNIDLVLADDFDQAAINDGQEVELLKLHSAVGKTIQTHHFIPAMRLPTKAKEPSWSLGTATQYLQEKYDADYAVFVHIADSYASAGRKAAIIIVAVLFGVGMQGGVQTGFSSLVDLNTGDIVWFNRLARGTGDLREAEPARETVNVLLKDFPKVKGGRPMYFAHRQRWCRVALMLLVGLSATACQTASSNEKEFALANTAGFDGQTGAALPLPVPEKDTAAEERTPWGETQRETPGPEENWSKERYSLPPVAPSERPAAGTDEAGIWMVADRHEDAAKVSAIRVTDPDLVDYLEGVVCRVAGAYCADVRTYVLRIASFNASMRPNGMMVIHTGLLVRVTSEAELAYVLGHETGHYLLRHSLLKRRKAADTATGRLIFGAVTGAAGMGGIGDLASIMAQGELYEHSRDSERQADGYGYALMVRAGYDPTEAPYVWLFLTRETEAQGGKDEAFFTRTHPVNAERIEMGRRMAEQAEASTDAVLEDGRDRYVRAILPFRDGMLQDELDKGRFGSFSVVLERWRKVGVNNGEIEFFQGEAFRLRANEEMGDYHAALQAYSKALILEGAPPRIYRSIGLVRHRLGHYEKASEALTHYLELVPDAEDKAILKLMIQEATS